MQTQKISLLSISDCTETNGIVTFIKVFLENEAHWRAQGFDLRAVCYRDAPGTTRPAVASGPAVPSSGVVPPRADWLRRCLGWTKTRLKHWLSGGAHRSFLNFLVSLAWRGLIVSLRARCATPTDIYFHQDFFTAFFSEKLRARGSRSILVLHGGRDPLRQLFIYFRPLLGTGYERLIRWAFEYALRRQDMVVTLSHALAGELKERHGLKHVTCIYNTSQILRRCDDHYPWEKQSVNCLAIGSLQYVKGFDLLIAAIASLEKHHRTRLKVVIIGEGAERGRLQQSIDQHGLNSQIEMPGNSTNVAYFLTGADLYLLPSRDEGMPIALIEAMQMSLPVLATRVGAIPEVVESAAGLLMSADVATIATALVEVIDGQHDLRRMGLASRKIYDEKLSMRVFIEQYGKLFSLHSSRESQ